MHHLHVIFSEIFWKVNFDRFHQDFRDDIMIEAITRQIDENGEQTISRPVVATLIQLITLFDSDQFFIFENINIKYDSAYHGLSSLLVNSHCKGSCIVRTTRSARSICAADGLPYIILT